MATVWKPPNIRGAAHFAYWEHAAFGYVTQTAHPVGRWLMKVFPGGKDDGTGAFAYARTEAQAKKFVERWAAANHHRIAPARIRQIMPHEGAGGSIKARKPKGSDDRS